jgi:hypothetical protein
MQHLGILVYAALLALQVNGADAQQTAPKDNPAPQASKPVHDDVPPFLHARGGGGPPAFAISGLASGYAQIATGVRVFAVCWSGGQGPFDVALIGPDGAKLVEEANVDGNELVKASRPVTFTAGVYRIQLTDAARSQVEGSFHVAATQDMPALPAPTSDPLAAALAASAVSPAFSYEAYLRVAPTSGGPDTASGQAVARLCHQSE